MNTAIQNTKEKVEQLRNSLLTSAPSPVSRPVTANLAQNKSDKRPTTLLHSGIRNNQTAIHVLEAGPLELLIFQGTPFCNINCSYCYLPDRLNKGKISTGIIQQTLERLLTDKLIQRDFTVLWHAGEPLVLPISFYENAAGVIREMVPRKFIVTHSFQTNGLLINQSWCDYFIRAGAELGLSLDGPQFIHDCSRKTRSGKGTFRDVMRAVGLLKRSNIELNCIAVLTSDGCNYPDEIFQFFREIGTHHLSFNVEEIEGVNTRSSFSNTRDSKERVIGFLEAIHRLNLLNGEPLHIREIEWAKGRILAANLHPHELTLSTLTAAYRTITVDIHGNFSTYSPELIALAGSPYGDFILGNVYHDSFAGAVHTEKFKRIQDDLMGGLNKCKAACAYYGMCSGGSPSNKVSEHHSLNVSETEHCKLVFQAPIDAMLHMVAEEANSIQS